MILSIASEKVNTHLHQSVSGHIVWNNYSLLTVFCLTTDTTHAIDQLILFPQDTQKGWVSAIQTAPMYQNEPNYPESYLRRNDLRVHDPYTSMPFSDAIFKEKCRSRWGCLFGFYFFCLLLLSSQRNQTDPSLAVQRRFLKLIKTYHIDYYTILLHTQA